MSHSVVGVVLPKGYDKVLALKPEAVVKATLEQAVAGLLAPYDENLEVPEYPEPCVCIDLRISEYRNDHMVTDIEDIRKAFHDRESQGDLQGKSDDEISTAWQLALKPYHDEQKRWEDLAVKLGLNTPDPDCEDCRGRGIVMSTANPNARWDWYEIGGRWGGFYRESSVNSGDGKNYCRVSSLMAANQHHFALLTDKGWVEKGTMGWFGMVADEKADQSWESEEYRILNEYRDRIIVAVDVHI
jgi:hypothetical protein